MSIHKPKFITSSEGLGLNTKKSLEFITPTLAINTETWRQIDTPWREGVTIIAQENYKWVTKWEADKPFIITKFYDATKKLVGTYCDISLPVKRIDNGFSFYDMYLDIWQLPDSKPVILDEDELSEALSAGYITAVEAANAIQAARKVITLLRQPDTTEF